MLCIEIALSIALSFSGCNYGDKKSYIYLILCGNSTPSHQYSSSPPYEFEEAMISISNDKILCALEVTRSKIWFDFELIINENNREFFNEFQQYIKDNPLDKNMIGEFHYRGRSVKYDS